VKPTCLALVVVAGLGGRAFATERIEPSGAADTEQLRGNVLVWTDATLYTEPTDTATTLHAASLPAARKDSVGAVVPMHVVSIAKGFVEVEPATELDCTWSRLQTSDDLARLRVFVKRTDLAPVLVTAFEKTFEDGSRIAMRPGVALVPTADGKFVVGVHGGGEVAVELPAAAVGHAYTPDKSKVTNTLTDREYVLAPKTAVAFGEGKTTLDGHHAIGVQHHGATTLFSIVTRCVALDVIAPTKAVRAVDDDTEAELEPSSGLGVLDLRDQDYIPAGTVLSTPSGHAIAAAAKPIYLMSAPHGKTACIDRRVRVGTIGSDALAPADGDDKIRVCAPSARVFHERVRSSSSANGTTRR
jgi:hypothetical protein